MEIYILITTVYAQQEIKTNSYDFSERLLKLFLAKICKANSCLTEGKKTSREKGGGHLAGEGVGGSGAIQRPQKAWSYFLLLGS